MIVNIKKDFTCVCACLNPSGGQALLSVWYGVRGISDAGSEEPGPLHLRHEVPSPGVADVPSLCAG